MSAQAVGHVWRYADFGGAKLLVLLAVADIANDVHNQELWIGSEKLGAKCRMNPGNVRKRLKELVEDGWLIELVTGGGMGKTSRYQFVLVDITASPGAEAEPNRVDERAEPRPTARLYKENSNELKTKTNDSVSCVADGIVDNDGPQYQRHHPAHQIDTNTAGIARARSALTDGDNNNNPANNPPPPANT